MSAGGFSIAPEHLAKSHSLSDIGTNPVSGEGDKQKIVSDVDTDRLKDVASGVTPIPGGLGLVTVAMFMRNSIVAHGKQLAAGWLD